MRMLSTMFLKLHHLLNTDMFVLIVLLLILVVVDSGVPHTCGGGYWRKKHNVDRDNLDGHDNDTLQINQNWIWKKN